MVSSDRKSDIERTVEELRLKFQADFEPSAAMRNRVLRIAAADPRVTDAAFRVLYVQSAYGNPDGTRIKPSTATIAGIVGSKKRSVERANALLEQLGYIITERRQRMSSERSLQIPDEILFKLTPIRETTPSSVKNDAFEPFSNVKNDALENPNASKMTLSSVKNDALQYRPPSNDPITDTDACAKSVKNDVLEIPHETLMQRLCEAAGDAIDDPARSPGLIVLSDVHCWLANGCDLELDVLPAIAAKAAMQRPRSIRSWVYFTQPVANAKARRLAPMPAGNATPPPARRMNWDDEIAARQARGWEALRLSMTPEAEAAHGK